MRVLSTFFNHQDLQRNALPTAERRTFLRAVWRGSCGTLVLLLAASAYPQSRRSLGDLLRRRLPRRAARGLLAAGIVLNLLPLALFKIYNLEALGVVGEFLRGGAVAGGCRVQAGGDSGGDPGGHACVRWHARYNVLPAVSGEQCQ